MLENVERGREREREGGSEGGREGAKEGGRGERGCIVETMAGPWGW